MIGLIFILSSSATEALSHDERKRTMRIHLNFFQYRKLAEFVAAEYTKSNMTDEDFAVHAVENLGFQLTEHHIKQARGFESIPSNGSRVSAKTTGEVVALRNSINDLVRRCDTLTLDITRAHSRITELEKTIGLSTKVSSK